MGCRQCLHLQLKGKHCRKPHCRNGVVDTFGCYVLYLTSIYLKVYMWIEDSEIPSLASAHPATCSLLSQLALGSACNYSRLSWLLSPVQCLGDLSSMLVPSFFVMLANYWVNDWSQVGKSLKHEPHKLIFSIFYIWFLFAGLVRNWVYGACCFAQKPINQYVKTSLVKQISELRTYCPNIYSVICILNYRAFLELPSYFSH